MPTAPIHAEIVTAEHVLDGPLLFGRQIYCCRQSTPMMPPSSTVVTMSSRLVSLMCTLTT